MSISGSYAHMLHLSDACTTAKKQREEDQSKRDATDRDISEFFTKGTTKAQPNAKVGRRSSTPRLDDMPLTRDRP